MPVLLTLFQREFKSYFHTPIAYVFLVVFLLLSGGLTFYLGSFFERGQANLDGFFLWHMWLYLFLVPAISMRLWSEERRSGTIELLLTLPVTITQAVLAKFFAAWAFIGVALMGTLPMWITVSYLGDPDQGVIVAGYVGSMLMAGGFVALCQCASAITQNQVIAFIVGIGLCFIFIVSGLPASVDLLSWLPALLQDVFSYFSFMRHYDEIARGILSLASVFFFFSVMALGLYCTTLVIDYKRGT